jgi:hypothetical protein
MKLVEITPKRLQCGVGPCPSVFETDRGTYVIVGTQLSSKQVEELLPDKVAPHEGAIEIAKDFLSEIKHE